MDIVIGVENNHGLHWSGVLNASNFYVKIVGEIKPKKYAKNVRCKMTKSDEERLNKYTCRKCGGFIITIDRDEGVTPFMICCRASEYCNGDMFSAFYDNVSGIPTFEWRKPTSTEYAKASKAMREHYDKGGLNIYPINEESSLGVINKMTAQMQIQTTKIQQFETILEKADALDFDEIIHCISLAESEWGFEADDEKEQLNNLQQAIADYKKGE